MLPSLTVSFVPILEMGFGYGLGLGLITAFVSFGFTKMFHFFNLVTK